jgi:hypothetical protein
MFGHCVWYTICKDHLLSVLSRRLSLDFKCHIFPAHITILNKVVLEEADILYRYHCQIKKPWFKINGPVYQTKTDDFYALQMDIVMYNIMRLGDYHVSLAYRVGSPFTIEEIERANDLISCDTISSENLYVSLNDCRSKYAVHWRQLKRCIV